MKNLNYKLTSSTTIMYVNTIWKGGMKGFVAKREQITQWKLVTISDKVKQ